MKNKKLISISLAAIMGLSVLTGCDKFNIGGDKQEQGQVIDTATKEIRQNDYRGSVIRTQAIRDQILTVVKGMMANNSTIRAGQPNNFWSDDDYKDFVINFLTCPIINDTGLMNEEETDWDTVISTTLKTNNSFTQVGENGYASKYPNIQFIREYKDHYWIKGVTGIGLYNGLVNGDLTYRIDYDADKDMSGAYAAMEVSVDGTKEINPQMFEYRRLSDDAFLIQTSNERIYIEFESLTGNADSSTNSATSEAAETKADTPAPDKYDLRNRKVKTFYYSRLTGGVRTTFKPYELQPEYDDDNFFLSEVSQRNNEYINSYYLNENGDLINVYGRKSDSMFLIYARPQSSNGKTTYTYWVKDNDGVKEASFKDWVFEDTALKQGIVYENGAMVVDNYNNLTEMYDQFIYYVNGKDDAETTANKLAAEKIAESFKTEDLTGQVDLITVKQAYENEVKDGKAKAAEAQRQEEKETEPTDVDTTGGVPTEPDRETSPDMQVDDNGNLVEVDRNKQADDRANQKEENNPTDNKDKTTETKQDDANKDKTY